MRVRSGMAGADVIVGIDLGTTNSLVAVCDERGPRVVGDESGRALVPSVVRYGGDNSALTKAVGVEAKESAAAHPLLTISSVKRLMGRSVRDAARDLPYLPYRVVAGEHGQARIALPLADGERLISPQEVSADVLGRLKQIAERALGHEVRKAVVTVPAYFDDAQRQATRDAGRLAGLEVVRIVNEPTAAALAYGLGLERAASRNTQAVETVAVYDLGGGTFDVSVLKLTPSTGEGGTAFFQVLATAGDTHLGGDDFDHAIVAMLAEDLARRGVPPPDAGMKRSLIQIAERAKIELSERTKTEVVIPTPSGEVRRAITRNELEAATAELVERTMQACSRVLHDASKAARKSEPVPGVPVVDAVVLVGGMTRMPLVRRRVAEFFGLEPYTALDPDQVVALGAAVQAGVLAGVVKGALLLDVIPLSLGVETAGGAVAKLIVRNSAVPTRAKEMFSTSVDGQTSIKLHILQGEREMAGDCRSLGEFHLRGIPPMPAGVPQLEVEFLVDANGVLIVSAHERRSGRRAGLQIVPNHGLTRDEVDRMERESLKFAREDMTRHRVVDLIVNAKLDLKWISERLGKFGDKLEPQARELLAAKVQTLSGMVAKAQADWQSVEPDALHAAKHDLDTASLRLQEISIAESLRKA